jgi:hypothetical protein
MLGTRGDGAKKHRVTLLQTYPGWDLRGETTLVVLHIGDIVSGVMQAARCIRLSIMERLCPSAAQGWHA